MRSLGKRLAAVSILTILGCSTLAKADFQIDDDEKTTTDQEVYGVLKVTNEDEGIHWTYTSAPVPKMSFLQYNLAGTFEDQVYYVQNGSVSCFDLYTGEKKWSDPEYAGSAPFRAFLIDSEGTLYLSGIKGPDLFAVSKDGESLFRLESYCSDYDYVDELHWKDPDILLLGYADEATETIIDCELSVSALLNGEIDGVQLYSSERNSSTDRSEDTSVCMYSVIDCEEFISLRQYPDTNANRLCKIPLHAHVEYVSDAGEDFAEVIYDGQQGYVLKEYLAVHTE